MPESVELCLELQMNEDVKKILKSPERCRSAVLDVTVIKPKELEAFGTQTTNVMRAEQVRKLISSMEKQRREKQKLIENLKHDDTIIKVEKHRDVDYEDNYTARSSRRKRSPESFRSRKNRFSEIGESVEPLFCEIRRSLKNVETRITSMKDLNLVISHTTTDETTSNEFVLYKNGRLNTKRNNNNNHLNNKVVYRAAKTEKDLKSILLCQNNRGERTEGKCLCENCGIVGLLKECQKQPIFLSEPMTDKPERRKPKASQNQKVDPFETSLHIPYLDELFKRIKYLEARLSEQEEKSVPKDYFKHIITKLVNSFGSKGLKSATASECSAPEPEYKLPKKQEIKVEKSDYYQTEIDCFHLTPTLLKRPPVVTSDRKNTDKSTTTEDFLYYSGNFWRWGEEILRPGIDLKNRIVTLVNEIISKFALSEKMTVPYKRNQKHEDLPFCNAKVETIRDDSFKKLVNHINTKVFNAHTHYKSENTKQDLKNDEGKGNKTQGVAHEEMRQRYVQNNSSGDPSKKIDVAYVNPKISMWQKESHTMNEVESCDLAKFRSKTGKDEFLKVLTRAKESQKLLLWKNIWEQAKANGQTIEDRINIKIPLLNKDGKMSNQVYEIEMSIGEIGSLLMEKSFKK